VAVHHRCVPRLRGFSVPFAFAIAMLITGRVHERWPWSSPLDGSRWGALSLGIVLGAWWSYQVLGWEASGAGTPSRTPRCCPG